MKILVLYAMAGGGHLSASKALQAQLAGAGFQVALEDSTKPFGRLVDFCCCDLYKISAKHFPWLFGLCYRLTDSRRGASGFMRFAASLFGNRLLPIIQKHDPDVIVCAYPFVCQIMSRMKAKGLISAKVVHMLTDYGLHAAWISQEADGYLASCADAAADLQRRGVPAGKIHVCGIPVRPEFRQPADRDALRAELGLSPDLPVLLFMAGSFGVKSVFSVFRALDALPDPFEAVVITGKNDKLFAKFQELAGRSAHRLHPILFTSRVADYMHACDLLVTKPGGLTTSEALACNIPLAVFDAIPGQEEDNARFLLERRAAVRLRSSRPKESAGQVAALLRAPEKLAEMRENCRTCLACSETLEEALGAKPGPQHETGKELPSL